MPYDPDFLAQLLLNPQETLDVEFKNWLDPRNDDHRPKIAKELLALANHGGGFLIFGFVDKSMQPDPNRPVDFSAFTPDLINAITRKFADPPFQCEVHTIAHPASGEKFPIVCVPGEHRVPIRCKAGCSNNAVEEGRYYTRLPGPESGTPRSSKDWDDIMRRCLFSNKEQLLTEIRSILTGHVEGKAPSVELEQKLSAWLNSSEEAWAARLSKETNESPEHYYPFGTWTIAYSIFGMNETISIEKLANIMQDSPGKNIYPSWDVAKGPVTKRYFDTNTTAEWLQYAGESYWNHAWTVYARLSESLDFFLKGGYIEDVGASTVHPQPGKVFYTSNAIEFLLRTSQHAAHICQSLGTEDLEIILKINWSHASGRRLFVFWDAPDSKFISSVELMHALTDRERIEVAVGPVQIGRLRANFEEMVLKPVQTIFRTFNFSMDDSKAKNYIASAVETIRRGS